MSYHRFDRVRSNLCVFKKVVVLLEMFIIPKSWIL
jgi:hypothetical protein